MKIGSLFAGIGGLELGLERAGVGHTVWQVERDEFCRKVLARHWPEATRYEDVTTVDWSTVEPVEVLCGGFPCQDISLAGKGAGLAGERSGLWREYLGAVRVLRPRFVVVENVAALLARGLGDVLADLASCGYDTEWDCVPAAAVGAPHRRDRLFVLAYSGSSERGRGTVGGPGRDRQSQLDGTQGHLADTDDADGEARRSDGVGVVTGPGDRQSARQGCESGGPHVADDEGLAIGTGLRPCEPAGQWRGRPSDLRSEGHTWAVEPDVGRVAHGVPQRVDRLRALGNAVVPQVAEVVGARLLALSQEGAA